MSKVWNPANASKFANFYIYTVETAYSSLLEDHFKII